MSAAEQITAETTTRSPRVLLLGNPNTGKTTLFNRLSGARARVGNFPGVTVERRSAEVRLPGGGAIDLVDVPGTYSLSARSPEEAVAVQALWEGEPPAVVVVVVDSTAMTRGLYLALQVIESGLPTVLALNLADEAKELGLEISSEGLERTSGVPAISLSAATGAGVGELLGAIEETIGQEEPKTPKLEVQYPPEVEAALEAIASGAEGMTESDSTTRSRAALTLLSVAQESTHAIPEAMRVAAQERLEHADNAEDDLVQALIAARYREIEAWSGAAVTAERAPRVWTERMDALLTHRLFGVLSFAAVMLVVFQTLFAWSDPFIGMIEDAVAWAQSGVGAAMSEGVLRGLVVDGVIAGVGNVIVFVPQIALLFVLITLLEDSGYLARVAFVIDRLMKVAGLNGRAFVPMLSGFACAIPAVMATRIVEQRRDRLALMMAIPFMSCSARLPIYVLVSATLFSGSDPVFAGLSMGALVLFSMYALSVVAALFSVALLRRTLLKGPRSTLVLELPPYRMPRLGNVLRTVWDRVWDFIRDAGTVILAFTIILWALLSYPIQPNVIAEAEEMRVAARAELEGDALEARLTEIQGEEAGEQLRQSYAGSLGRALEPVLEPLGFDWRMGVGIIGAFAAREVFVSTLGIVFSIEDADGEEERLRERLREAERDDGTPLFTPLVGVSLMVFFVLACQCMSTLAVVRRESQSWRWPIFMFFYMTILAYVASLLVFQIGTLLGWGGG